ncbi:MAG: type II toxin-antitoxin system HicB family antitoxin [Eubacteriales bacterium]|nr:type II toxin-antitoxin system HicB family antitoxin [Eubacteriales bacterium]
MNFVYPAVFHKKEDGTYTASFPDLEMCQAVGDDLDECMDNAISAAHDWIYVELTEFDGELPSVSDAEDLQLEEGDELRNISVNIRITDGWDE